MKKETKKIGPRRATRRLTYFIIAIKTVFFSAIFDGTNFSCSFLNRPETSSRPTVPVGFKLTELSVLNALVVGINPKNKKSQLLSLQEEETNTKKKVTRLIHFEL